MPGGPFRSDIGMYAAGIRKAGLSADRRVPPTEPVDRDPCPRCGVRGDIGCGHSRVRLGMVL
jgi:hypothetical protein